MDIDWYVDFPSGKFLDFKVVSKNVRKLLAKKTVLAQICYLQYYTVSHKKRATLFLIITPAFLGRFLYFLYQLKREEIFYNLLT